MIKYNTKFVIICNLLHIITLPAGKLVPPSVLWREHNLKCRSLFEIEIKELI